jgi:hypothetical protein
LNDKTISALEREPGEEDIADSSFVRNNIVAKEQNFSSALPLQYPDDRSITRPEERQGMRKDHKVWILFPNSPRNSNPIERVDGVNPLMCWDRKRLSSLVILRFTWKQQRRVLAAKCDNFDCVAFAQMQC